MEYEPDTEELDPLTLRSAADWVVRLNDPAVAEADFMRWQAWLTERAANARAFQQVQEAWQRSANVSRTSPGSALALKDMRDELQTLLDSSRRRRTFVGRLAAAAVILVAILIAVIRHEDTNLIETSTAELRSVRLPDGSRAALGPETRLEVDFSAHDRLLRMSSGEAYFEVAHAQERPFSVITPSGRAIAVGTAFSVHTIEGRVSVSVTQGVVRVEPAAPTDAAGAAGALVVKAGQRLVRDRTHTQIEPLSADALAWQQGRLQYQAEPLRVVISDINRYSSLKLRIADSALGELRYTGTVFPDSLEAWLASVEGVFPVRIETTESERLIVAARPKRED